MKVGIGGFVLPFMIALFPLLMWESTAPVFMVAGLIACVVSLFVFQVGFVGYFLNNLNIAERALFILGGLGLMGYLYTRNQMVFIIAVILIILLFLFQLHKKKKRVTISGS